MPIIYQLVAATVWHAMACASRAPIRRSMVSTAGPAAAMGRVVQQRAMGYPTQLGVLLLLLRPSLISSGAAAGRAMRMRMRSDATADAHAQTRGAHSSAGHYSLTGAPTC
eukprot:SAG31_NODE_10226_length_1168_cov_0.909261_3_plen_109_part_01